VKIACVKGSFAMAGPSAVLGIGAEADLTADCHRYSPLGEG
jgi:hypothetical protein